MISKGIEQGTTTEKQPSHYQWQYKVKKKLADWLTENDKKIKPRKKAPKSTTTTTTNNSVLLCFGLNKKSKRIIWAIYSFAAAAAIHRLARQWSNALKTKSFKNSSSSSRLVDNMLYDCTLFSLYNYCVPLYRPHLSVCKWHQSQKSHYIYYWFLLYYSAAFSTAQKMAVDVLLQMLRCASLHCIYFCAIFAWQAIASLLSEKID